MDHKNQKLFLTGTIPTQKPDGLYYGTISRKTSWVGKKFNAQESSGINMFYDQKGEKIEKYPFKTYVGKGLVDKNLEVIKITVQNFNILIK